MNRTADDDGFGLVEIVVAMLVLAILSLALLPLLVNGLKSSRANATMATAAQYMDAEFDAAQSITACGSVPTTTVARSDSRGTALTVTRTRGACPTSYPGTVSYSVTVTRDDSGATLAAGKTLLYVTGN